LEKNERAKTDSQRRAKIAAIVEMLSEGRTFRRLSKAS
jgi:hypothetical protein